MPSEMRKMVFTRDELQAALINYALRTKQRLPNANIEHIKVEKADGVKATIIYARLADEEPKTVEFDETNVAAAIFLYCRTHNIPLPREARKVIIPEGGSVSMIVQMDHSPPAPGIQPAAAQEMREDAEAEAVAASAEDTIEKAAAATAQKSSAEGSEH